MSVIYGLVHTGRQPVEAGVLDAMNGRLNHWQADASANWRNGCAGLGHLMLFNTPESLNEKLPFFDSESNTTITADARIDNREELYTILHLHTADDRKLPDSTLILMLYNKYGKECVNYIIGDFAFAIWDEKIQQLFCARDHMGVKPFFYYNDSNLFAFASEKKGILAIPQANKEIDKDFFYKHLIWPKQYSATATLYEYIFRLAPGHLLILNAVSGSIAIKCYWTLDTEQDTNLASTQDYYKAFKYHFDEAVKCRLRTAYSLGAELSGGLDSSAIVSAAVHSFQKQALYTFSRTLHKSVNDPRLLALSERRYIEEVIKFNGIANAVFITEDVFKDPLAETDFALEVNDGLEIWNPLMHISVKDAAMKKGVRTLLSGFPGDEMVSSHGSKSYLDLYHKREYKELLANCNNWNDLKKIMALVIPYYQDLSTYANKINVHLKSKKKQPFIIPWEYVLKEGFYTWQNEYEKNRNQSYRHFLSNRLLRPQPGLRMEAETRLGIYFRSEPRFPMADIRLTQFYLSIPDKLKYAPSARYTYRKALCMYLPRIVAEREDKPANMAPYRTFKSEIDKKKKITFTVYKDVVDNKFAPINKKADPSIVYLDALRWVQKNF